MFKLNIILKSIKIISIMAQNLVPGTLETGGGFKYVNVLEPPGTNFYMYFWYIITLKQIFLIVNEFSSQWSGPDLYKETSTTHKDLLL